MSEQLTPSQVEILQRARALLTPKIDISADCFPVQRAFVQDNSKHATAVCSRRSGKTVAAAKKLLAVAQGKPGAVCLYIGLTRLSAKRNLWGTLTDEVQRHKLNARINESELFVKLANGATIYIGGANDKSEIDKFRGLPLAIVVLDETQSFPGFIKELIDAIISPALMDYDGSLVLLGTPGPVKAGYFYECATNKEWTHHGWTVWDNPWIKIKSGKSADEHLASEMARRGVSADEPVLQREFYGRWVHDPNSLVFRYDATRNDYQALPVTREWTVVVGVDLGWDDADAIAVLGWPGLEPNLYLLEEVVTPKQSITDLGKQLQQVEERWKPQAWVADFGGLGKKIGLEIEQRLEIPLQPADKVRKIEHIELLNDALRTGHFFARKESRFAQETQLVEWDRDKSNPEKYVISDKFHSDILDAVLYAYRHASHWLDKPAEPKPQPGQAEWFKGVEQEMLQAAEAECRERKADREALETDLGWI